MKPRMSETIFEQERQIVALEKNLALARAEIESLKNGDAMKKLYHRINRLTSFANDCIRWGAAPCRCQYEAENAINDASEYNTHKEEP